MVTEALKTILIANQGEIAVRIIRTAKAQNIRKISIYTKAGAASAHVALTDEAILLKGLGSKAYIDREQIIEVVKSKGVNAIISGYGFLFENSDVAKLVTNGGIVFAGPSPEITGSFGLKHWTKELAKNEEGAVEEAKKLEFPVMLKATAGGGDMGLLTYQSAEEIQGIIQHGQIKGRDAVQEFKNVHGMLLSFRPSH